MQSRSKAPTPVSPIDSDEQENIMMQLKADAITQSLQIRNIFFFLYLAIAGIMIVCIFYTIAAPYHMQHQKHFEYLVQIEIFYLFYASSAYTFIVGAFIAKRTVEGIPKLALYPAYIIGAFSLAAWGMHFYLQGVNNPLFWWMPAANFLSLLLAKYVDRDYKTLLTSAEDLKQYAYDFKTI